jgi:hypothetical protein
MRKLALVCFLVVSGLAICRPCAIAQGTTAFTYQGQLDLPSGPATGTYQMVFRLYDALSGGNVRNGPVTNSVAVSNGLFTTQLDLGPLGGVAALWLEIGVRTNGSTAAHTLLAPRQRMTPTPYAIYAARAGDLQAGASPTFTGSVTFNPFSGPPFNVANNTKVPNLNADLLDGIDSSAFVLKAGDTMTGNLTLANPASLNFGNNTRQMLNLWSSVYGVGVQAGTLYFRSDGSFIDSGNFAWYRGGVHADGLLDPGGGTTLMTLENTGRLTVEGGVRVNFASPFNRPQLEINDPADTGFARIRMRTGTRALWDIATGTTPGLLQTNSLRFFSDGNGDVMTLSTNGNLFVRVVTITGGADLAEPFQISDKEITKGAVVIIDEEHPGQLKLSEHAYDTRVAGIVSGANGVNPGLMLSQQGTLEGNHSVALSGRVYVQADASKIPIKPGDLLTTADAPGHAMKVTDPTRAQGAILGKAMTGLKEGKGLVLVLVSLQ